MSEVLWETNFDKATFDKEWNIEEMRAGQVNNELQRYTKSNVLIENEGLKIITQKYGNDIRSGRINSKNKVKFLYGKVEADIKFSSGKGLWPAFWAMGNNDLKWPDRGEIDIMEWVGWKPDSIYGTLHGPGYCGGNCLGSGGKNVLNKILSDEYHKYAIEWEPNKITWYIDDKEYYSATSESLKRNKGNNTRWVFNDTPFYLIINMAVGGCFGGAYKDYPHDVYANLNENTELCVKNVKISKTKNGYGTVYH